MYKVIKLFVDLKDNYHVCKPGDAFPRAGLKVTDARLAELSGSKNKQGEPLIKKEDEPAKKTAKKPAAK